MAESLLFYHQWPKLSEGKSASLIIETRLKIQSPTAYISVGIKSKNNLNTPIKNLKKIIYAIQDSKASINDSSNTHTSVNDKDKCHKSKLWCNICNKKNKRSLKSQYNNHLPPR